MLTTEMFKQQLEDDPDREYFDVMIYTDFMSKRENNLETLTNDRITEEYFFQYCYKNRMVGIVPLVETIVQRERGLRMIEKVNIIRAKEGMIK